MCCSTNSWFVSKTWLNKESKATTLLSPKHVMCMQFHKAWHKCYKTEWQLRCSSTSDASWGSRFLMARHLQTSHDQAFGFWVCRTTSVLLWGIQIISMLSYTRACWASFVGGKGLYSLFWTDVHQKHIPCRAKSPGRGWFLFSCGTGSCPMFVVVLSLPGTAQPGTVLKQHPNSLCSRFPLFSLCWTYLPLPWPHALLLPKTHSWLSNSSLLGPVHGEGPASKWNVVQQQLWALPPPSTSHSPSTVRAKFVHLFLLGSLESINLRKLFCLVCFSVLTQVLVPLQLVFAHHLPWHGQLWEARIAGQGSGKRNDTGKILDKNRQGRKN